MIIILLQARSCTSLTSLTHLTLTHQPHTRIIERADHDSHHRNTTTTNHDSPRAKKKKSQIPNRADPKTSSLNSIDSSELFRKRTAEKSPKMDNVDGRLSDLQNFIGTFSFFLSLYYLLVCILVSVMSINFRNAPNQQPRYACNNFVPIKKKTQKTGTTKPVSWARPTPYDRGK